MSSNESKAPWTVFPTATIGTAAGGGSRRIMSLNNSESDKIYFIQKGRQGGVGLANKMHAVDGEGIWENVRPIPVPDNFIKGEINVSRRCKPGLVTESV